jgi:tetratricopeptide (TPR) repeat protein
MVTAARMLAAALLGLVSAPAQTTYAVLIGISEYTRPGIPQLTSANQDARLLYDFLAARRGRTSQGLHLLVSPESARNGEIKNTLHYVLSRAGPNDSVLLFVSAHGLQEPDQEAFIIPRDGDLDDRRWGVYRLSLLDGLVRQTRARRVLLFLDVSRARFHAPNLINAALEKLAANWPKAAGVLASRPGQLSYAAPQPPQPAPAAAGVFAGSLLEALQGSADADGNGVTDLLELARHVGRRVRQATRNAQQPMVLGQPGLLRGAAPVASAFPAWPQRLAFLAHPPAAPHPLLLFAAPLLQSAQALAFEQQFGPALSQGRLLEPGGALDLFQQHGPSLSPAQFAEARGRLAAALEDEGQQIVSWYAAGAEFASETAAVQRREFARAEALFAAAARLRSQTPAPEWRDLEARRKFCEGRLLTFDRRFDAALAALQAASRIDSEAAQPYNGMGIAYLESGRYDEAALQFQQALRRAPGWAFPAFNLALTSVERGDYGAAIRQYRSAIARAPHYPYLRYNLGLLLQRLNRRGEALQEYRAAFDGYTLQARDYRRRAERWLTSDADEADRARRRAGIMDRNRADVLNAIGALRDAQGRRGEARRQYEAALALAPDLLVARHNLGLLLARDDPDQAIPHWRENLRRDPAFVPSRLSLAGAHLRKRGFAAAAAAYREARAILAARSLHLAPATALDFANALYCAGDPAGALQQVRDALKRSPSSPQAHEIAGDLLARSGRLQDARDAYRAALPLAHHRRARKRLQRKLEGAPPSEPWTCASR